MLPQVPGQPTFLSHWDAGPTFPSYWEARQQWESVEAEAAISQHTAFLRDIDRDVDMGSEILAEQGKILFRCRFPVKDGNDSLCTVPSHFELLLVASCVTFI